MTLQHNRKKVESHQGTFPLPDPTYDVIAIIHQKSKALEAYDKYLQDTQSDTQLRQVVVCIRHDEQRHIELLKGHLARLLANEKA